MREGWKLTADGPRSYERYLVPVFFADCAEQLLDLAGVGPGDRVVDVACGTGIVARRAAARVGPAGAVTGLDVNDDMLAVARGADPGAPVTWLRADATDLPVDDAHADAVLCQQGLQYFPDPVAAVGEAHRVVRRGGRIGVAVWRSLVHHPGLGSAGARAGTRRRRAGRGDPHAGAVRRAGAQALRPRLLAGGFTDVRTRIGIITVRFPSTREFLDRQVAASPLAAVVGPLDTARSTALSAEVDRVLEPYVDDFGVAFPLQTWLAVARRA